MAATVGSLSIPTPDTEFVVLCDAQADGTAVPFLRRYTSSALGAVAVTDTGLDGTTSYTPTGTVTACLPGAPSVVEPHGVENTDWNLAANAGTQSITLLVYSGTVNVTTGDGTLTVPAGASMSWSVDGDGDQALDGTLGIDGTVPGATWHVLWTTKAA
ncbi:hypothetical protein E4K10_30735 [Streptomyces sp. T1317-0309]|nr:hypothetical protein E4K10_30735 [Streptomyces sp. T1317-0309]